MRKPRYYYIASKNLKKHKVSFYDEDGKRYAKFFATKSEAVVYMSDIKNQHSLPDELTFSVQERIVLSQIKYFCNQIGVPLDEAFSFIKNNLKVNNTPKIEFENALKAYCEYLQQKNVRTKTLNGYKQALSFFQRKEGVSFLSNYTVEKANNYLSCINSPNHAIRAIRPFFEFCKTNGWINTNPFYGVKINKKLKEKELPSVVSVEGVSSLFKNCPNEWKPTLALMAFAGIRPQELLSDGTKDVLKIRNIDFKNKKIVVPASVAKTRKERHLHDLPKNIWKWLKPIEHCNKNDNVAFGSYHAFRIIKKNHLTIKLDKDVLRHSFASYAYHYLGAELTIEIMGHERSFNMLADHYKGLADKKSAIEYFSIIPK